MNVLEFADLIEYYLSQMASRNDHHRFERLCTEIARRRVATNLLIATGPVGAGGDGGRDAESFQTSLPDEVSTWFSLRATTAAMAIACSLEKNYVSKIRSDTERIARSQDRKFDRIIFFSSQSIPSAKRTALGEELATHGCALAIWDRPAIAHALSEPDLHWLAQYYLNIPAELVESVRSTVGRGHASEDEIYYLPGQSIVEAVNYALSISPINTQKFPSDVMELMRRHVALHISLDGLPITDQHAYELSRKSDASAKILREKGSSGAEALRCFGLLE